MLGAMIREELTRDVRSKVGAALARPAFERFKRRVDYAEMGGAPLLGINGAAIICHGASPVKAIKNAVRVAGEWGATTSTSTSRPRSRPRPCWPRDGKEGANEAGQDRRRRCLRAEADPHQRRAREDGRHERRVDPAANGHPRAARRRRRTRPPSDLAVHAARQALERANLMAEDIDLIVVGTTRRRHALPDDGQHRSSTGSAAGMPGPSTSYAACAGSIYSLSVGAQYIETGKYRPCSASARKRCRASPTSPTAARACSSPTRRARPCCGRRTASGIIDTDLYSDGRYGELLIMPGGGARNPATRETVDARMHYAKMKGSEVFKVAVRMFVECARDDPRAPRLQADRHRPVHPAPGEPPHHRGRGQARRPADGEGLRQRRPLRQHRRRVRVRRARGGVGGRTREARRHVLLAAFGGGFAWGAALVRW